MHTYVRLRFGRPYYSFVYNNVPFRSDATARDGTAERPFLAGFSDKQVEFAAEALFADNAGVRWTFVFMHQPFFTEASRAWGDGTRLRRRLSGRPHTVFASWHEYPGRTVNGSASTASPRPAETARSGGADKAGKLNEYSVGHDDEGQTGNRQPPTSRASDS